MKTILVPTDFSAPANNAARYALHLAKSMKTGIRLCSAISVPAEAPMAPQIAWPLEDYTSIKSFVTEQLELSVEKLERKLDEQAEGLPPAYQPAIGYSSEVGSVTEVIRNTMDEQKMSLVVMGMSGAGGLSRFFLGSNSRDLVEKASFPVLLIPGDFTYQPIKKIAFATDLSKGDIEVIHSLAGMARYFNAEILVSHITDEKYENHTEQREIDDFLTEVSDKVNYPQIYYRHVKSIDVDRGLTWLYEHSQIDMLAMVHRPHQFLSKLIQGSHTQRLAKHITIPLLVFPPDCCAVI
ncbi:Nucleotide-binding universal stress protein, UspA family [Mucilaginibacter sp. OK268]|uniref:universal stress protein n=1 Tax=Mucilaginibacter sp. OK268 TaxID=1881048 RepID=UPI00087F6979|nr:universal stress protein [Mucilaginibacter sp. OK268]SDP96965.1 Nucleotide-binding universal stress protein, UspA family [Mucilaginibacter sp. OK268]